MSWLHMTIDGIPKRICPDYRFIDTRPLWYPHYIIISSKVLAGRNSSSKLAATLCHFIFSNSPSNMLLMSSLHLCVLRVSRRNAFFTTSQCIELQTRFARSRIYHFSITRNAKTTCIWIHLFFFVSPLFSKEYSVLHFLFFFISGLLAKSLIVSSQETVHDSGPTLHQRFSIG